MITFHSNSLEKIFLFEWNFCFVFVSVRSSFCSSCSSYQQQCQTVDGKSKVCTKKYASVYCQSCSCHISIHFSLTLLIQMRAQLEVFAEMWWGSLDTMVQSKSYYGWCFHILTHSRLHAQVSLSCPPVSLHSYSKVAISTSFMSLCCQDLTILCRRGKKRSFIMNCSYERRL